MASKESRGSIDEHESCEREEQADQGTEMEQGIDERGNNICVLRCRTCHLRLVSPQKAVLVKHIRVRETMKSSMHCDIA